MLNFWFLLMLALNQRESSPGLHAPTPPFIASFFPTYTNKSNSYPNLYQLELFNAFLCFWIYFTTNLIFFKNYEYLPLKRFLYAWCIDIQIKKLSIKSDSSVGYLETISSAKRKERAASVDRKWRGFKHKLFIWRHRIVK